MDLGVTRVSFFKASVIVLCWWCVVCCSRCVVTMSSSGSSHINIIIISVNAGLSESIMTNIYNIVLSQIYYSSAFKSHCSNNMISFCMFYICHDTI